MKKILFMALAVVVSTGAIAQATPKQQNKSIIKKSTRPVAVAPGKSATMNQELKKDGQRMNQIAQTDIANFQAFMSSEYKVEQERLMYMKKKHQVSFGELLIAHEISKQAKVDVARILTVRTQSRAKGWTYVMKTFGIKPGTPKFQAVRASAKPKKVMQFKHVSKQGPKKPAPVARKKMFGK